jgi:antitoxin (DNA-binding transcriptional repressor) of toxin-antitoxin stability system
MPTVTLGEAQARLTELIGQLQPGEEMIITEQGQPLAKVKRPSALPGRARRAAPRERFAWPPTSTLRLRTSRSTWGEPLY